MEPSKNTFKKGERLKRRKLIKRLFNREGKSLAVYPLRIIWLEAELDSTYPAQFGLSVPKRAFPKAAHRNRIRRRLREAYRLNKNILYDFIVTQEKQYAIMVLYTAKEVMTFQEIDKKMKIAIRQFVKRNS